LNCQFNGEIVLDQNNVIYAVECQQLLNTLGDSLGANYFVFDRQRETCRLFADSSRV